MPQALIVMPAKAGIQYAEASRLLLAESGGILDHPLSRMMTGRPQGGIHSAQPIHFRRDAPG
jgi:hypothetical protein